MIAPILYFALLAADAHACMEMASFRKLFPETAAAEPGTPEPVPEAVVLFDETPAYAAAPPALSTIVWTYGTGECVRILEKRAAAILVRRDDAPAAWVRRDRLYVFDRSLTRYDYDRFLDGGRLASGGGLGDRQLEIVESRGFALRASRHARPSVSRMGARRLDGLDRPRPLEPARWSRLAP